MKKFLIFFTALCNLLFIISFARAQTDSLLNLINDLSENETGWAEQLLDLQENPVNINFADKERLLDLPLLGPQLADSILKYRERYGRYENKRQIRSIIGPLYDLIKNYITASRKQSRSLYITHRNIYKIEKIPQIESGVYSGDALNDYTRIKYQPDRHITAGLVTQKDAGEKNYLDHYNFSLHYKNKSLNLLLGDFNLQLAEGLSHNNPYGQTKSIYLNAVFREAALFGRPDLTSSESTGKFGLFSQYDFKKQLSIFAFYSRAQRDAQLTNNIISGINYAGFHRSASELYAKDRFYEENWGAGIRYPLFSSFCLITFFNHYSFSKSIERSASLIGMNQKRRQYFYFSGKDLSQGSVAYTTDIQPIKMSGELSVSDKGQPGWSQSIYYPGENLQLGFKYWYLNKNFQTIDGRVFDSGDPFPQGVTGFFSGISLKLNKHHTLSAFKKYEQRLWRSYFDPMPTVKDEWLGQWEARLPPVLFTSRFRSRMSEGFAADILNNQRIKNNTKSTRIQIQYKISKEINGRNRWEHTWLSRQPEKGTLFFQELNYNLNAHLSLSTRYTFFYTSSFESRIYEYERDLPGTFSNVALFGNGNKLYLLMKWTFGSNFSVWFKWRYMSKDQILDNGKASKILSRDVRMQIQWLL